jgi:non-heme chloroperoxidase
MPRSLTPIVGRVVWLSLSVACGHSHPRAPAATPTLTPPPTPPVAVTELRAMRVNGAVLSYRLAGDQGTPVVFIHGSYGDLDDWSAQVGAFARTHRVFVYSRRYHPPNPPQNDGQVYSPELHADDLAALLPVLGLAPAHVVGSGYGAYIALALAREHPDLVRTLVLGEPPVLAFLLRSPAGDSLRRAFIAATLDPARNAFARGDSVAGLRLFVDGTTDRRGSFDNLSAPARARVVAHSFEMRREMLADRRLYLPPLDCAALGRLAMPILLIQGERSARMFHVITTELARCLQSDTLITIPAAGHAINATNPAAYNQTVLQYLATH